MAVEDELDLAPDVTSPPDWANPNAVPPPEESGLVSDLGNAAVAGAYGLASGVGGAAEYVGGLVAEASGIEQPKETRATRLKQWGQEGAQAAVGRMSKQSQREAQAGFLPNTTGDDIFDSDVSALRSLALKTSMSIPSLVATIVPGAVVARGLVAAGAARGAAAAAGTGAAGSAGATLTGGGVFEEIQSEFRRMSDADLRSQVEPYAILRDDGMSEEEARSKLESYVIGSKPLIMAAITAGTSVFGLEGLASGLVAGTLKKGIARNAVKGATGEGAQEFVESGAESVLTQSGKGEVRGKGIDWYEALDKAFEGGTIGGILGAGTGAAFGVHDRKEAAKPDPTSPQQDGGQDAQPPSALPPVGPDGSPVPTLPDGTAQPPATAQAPATTDLGEEVDFFEDEPVDPSVTAALRPDAEMVATPIPVDADVTSTIQPIDANTATAEDIAAEVVAAVQQLPQQGNITAPEPVVSQPTTAAPVAEPVTTAAPSTRVLPSLTEEARAAQEAFNEDWARRGAETRAALRDQGELPTKTRIRDTNAVDGDGVEKMDRRKWVAAARRIADAQGDNTPEPVRATVQIADAVDGFAPKDPRRMQANKAIVDLQKKAAEHYRKVASDRKAAVSENFDSREATQGVTEGAGARVRQTLKRRADKASDAAKDVVTKGDSSPEEMVSDVNVRSKALAKRLANILDDAKAQGVTVPAKITEETPLYQNVLKRYRDALQSLNSRRVPKGYDSFADFVADVQTDELIARKGSPEDVTERFRVEGSLRGDDGVVVAEEAAEEIDESTEEQPEPAPVEPKERPPAKVEYDGAPSYTAGVQKKAVVEVTKRRTFTPPGKPANPTPAQAAAGNYKKKKIYPFGLPVSVETAKGQKRRGVDSDGQPWENISPADYGYIRRTNGADGEQIDVYVGPLRDIRNAPLVYIVNQQDPDTKKFDEHKAMIGFRSEEEALDAYTDGFSDGSGNQRIKSVEVMTVEEFRQWLKNPQRTETLSDQTLFADGWDTADTSAEPIDLRNLAPLTTLADLEGVATRNMTMTNAIALERIKLAGFEQRMANKGMDHSGRERAAINNLIMPVAEAIRKTLPNVKVLYIDNEHFLRIPGVVSALERGQLSNTPLGFYDPNDDVIVLNNKINTGFYSPAQMFNTLVHEGVHAALYTTIEQSPNARAQLQELFDVAKATWAAKNGRANEYGFSSIHEFISEAMSNPDFQNLLSSIEVPREFTNSPLPQTFWQKFIDFARSILHWSGTGVLSMREEAVRNNALEAAIRVTANLFDVSSTVGRRNETGMGQFYSALPGGVTDRAKSTAGWMRKTGYFFATLDYIRQMNLGLFVDQAGDALDKIVSTMQKITPYARSMHKESEQLAIDFLNWGSKNHEQARKMADLAVEATMMNVNLVDSNDPAVLQAANVHLGKDAARGWQAKANLARMQREFMSLPAEARKLWLDQAKYYRDTQNKVARETVNSLLEAVADQLTPAQRQDLVDKTMAGTLGDAEATLLGNKAVFNNLKDAAVLRTNSGVYFPLMRYGNHVVKARLKMGDLMGGTQINHNTVEFRAAKDGDARKAAKRYVDQTDMPVSNVRRVYYDRKTGQQLSADDAKGQDVDVGYRVILQRDGVFMFDTGTEAERFRREEADNYDQMSGVMPKADYNQDNTLSASQLSALMSAVRGMPDQKVSAARKLEIEQALHQAAARMLPGNRIQKRMIKRKNVAGASGDLARALLSYGQSSSGYLARAKYMPEIREALRRMRAIQADKTEISSQAVQRSLTIKEIERRIAGNVEKVQEPNRFVSNVLAVSFLDKLFSPAYSLLNAMQVQMTTYPYLAGKYGAPATAYQLSKAYGAVGLGRITMDGVGNSAKALAQIKQAALNTTDIAGDIKKRLVTQDDGKQLVETLDMLRERGALDDGALFELAQTVESGAGPVTTAIARVDRIARQLPAAVEQLNRSVVAVSTYRLATQRGKSHEAAMQEAFDTVMLTQFDYSNVNSPTVFQHPLARIALQFKKYAANMAVLLYDMVKRAFKGASLEERKAGRKALAQLVAVQMVTAGALSLPGLEFIKVFGLIAGALGLGGGYDDIERWLRKTAEEAIGQKPTELLLRGFSRALGIDLSTRLSLADMFLFGEPRDFSQDGTQAYLWRLAVGAPGGYIADLVAASNNLSDGDTAKAVEKIIPFKIISDTAKAVNKYRSGDYNAAEAGVQAFGLRPASAARKSEEIGDAIAKKQQDQQMRKRLEKRYMNASPSERKSIVADIKKYNATANWREKVSMGALDRRIKADDDKRAGRPNPDNK